MDRHTRRKIEYFVACLQEENPPRFGTGLYEAGDVHLLRLRMAYQRWLLMKVAAKFPQVSLLDAVVEVIAPACH